VPVPDRERARWVEQLAEIAQQIIELAEEEAARTDPWRWYCRLCGAEGSVDHGPAAREARDEAAEEHLRETPCGRREVTAREESGRLLHVWTYPRSAAARWN